MTTVVTKQRVALQHLQHCIIFIKQKPTTLMAHVKFTDLVSRKTQELLQLRTNKTCGFCCNTLLV